LRERSNNEVNRLRQSIVERQGYLTQTMAQIAEHEEYLRNNQRLLDAAIQTAQADGPSDEELLVELDAVERHALVRETSLTPNGGVFKVRTEPIELTHPDTGESTIVGEFNVTFNFTTGVVAANNLTNRRGQLDHPHIHDGRFCLGEVENTVRNLMRERKVSAVTNLVLSTLSHVNPEDDWGRTVYQWFDHEANAVAAGE
jgi:hypothetical protein